ncbi:DUF4332 domain-containing protein, partial [Candidatus Thorarchaeota archaeon]
LARKRREAGEKKERRDKRPEVIVEPLEEETKPEVKPEPEPPKKEEKPKKKAPKKKPAKKEEKPKKKAPKKKPAKKEKKTKKKAKVKKPDLTDIDGVGPKTADSLKAGGFKTVAALSKASVEKLSKKVDGVAETTATQYIESAKKLIADYEKAKK